MEWTAWWRRLLPSWQNQRELAAFRARQRTTRRKMAALVKDHPQGALTYQNISSVEEAAAVLARITSALRHWQEKSRRETGTTPFFIEAGRLEGKRPFLFVKPLGEEGWLFETNARGFVISQAVRIAERETFLRHRDSWDHVLLYRPDHGDGLLRLSSQRFGQEHLSYIVYQEQLLKALAPAVPL